MTPVRPGRSTWATSASISRTPIRIRHSRQLSGVLEWPRSQRPSTSATCSQAQTHRPTVSGTVGTCCSQMIPIVRRRAQLNAGTSAPARVPKPGTIYSAPGMRRLTDPSTAVESALSDQGSQGERAHSRRYDRLTWALDFRGYAARSSQARRMMLISSGVGWSGRDG